MDDLYNRTI